MSDTRNLDNMTYKELIRELIKRIDAQDTMIKIIDDRERIVQMMLKGLQGEVANKVNQAECNLKHGRLEGERTGRKNEQAGWRWSTERVIAIIIFAIGAALTIWGMVQ